MANSAHSLAVAVVGATGAAGGTVLRILEERNFRAGSLLALASPRSAGTTVLFRGEQLTVAAVSDAALEGADVVFFAAGSETSLRYAPVVAANGGLAIDKSSAYRMDPRVPLIVPEVNGDAIRSGDGILANPNCVAIPLSVVLWPLHAALGLRHITVATYQSASGAGHRLTAELAAQTQADAADTPPTCSIYPHVLHGNVVPGGWPMHGADTEEEVKVIEETRKVLSLPELAFSVTTVRVPVAIGHSAAVWAQFDNAVTAAQARAVLEAAPGVRVIDDPERQMYPTPRDAAGTDHVLVGRIRADTGVPGGIAFFVSADNLRKGAAANAVQVAELALACRTAAAH